VSTFRPFLLPPPRVCSRNRRLLPSYAPYASRMDLRDAPRNANISPALSRLHILPVATGVYGAHFQLSTLFLCASVANPVPKPCRVILLRTLCRSLRSFSHSLPLFSTACSLFLQNTGGWVSPEIAPFGINNFQILFFALFITQLSRRGRIRFTGSRSKNTLGLQRQHGFAGIEVDGHGNVVVDG
jgi:hypothetical protein